MDYKQSLNYIHSLLKFGIHPGLSRMNALLCDLDNPHLNGKFVHIAGTNGKGSTAKMLSEILKFAGYKTGLFISPYVLDFRERIQINGEMIGQEKITDLICEIKALIEKLSEKGVQPTEFEALTAMAFKFFSNENCDISVLETGLGGRLDSTNVIPAPQVAVITSVSMDHMNVLGSTIEEITREKCGIIKSGGAVIVYPNQNPKAMKIIKETAAKQGCRLIIPDMNKIKLLKSGIDGTEISYDGENIKIPLRGKHQIENAATAICAAQNLAHRGFEISFKHIKKGIEGTYFPARLDVISHNPLVIVDGAHNADGILALAEFIKEELQDKEIIAVIGMMTDKDYKESLSIIAPKCSEILAVKPNNPRALDAECLAKIASEYCKTLAFESPKAAFEEAIKIAANKENSVVLICGSLYLAAEAYANGLF